MILKSMYLNFNSLACLLKGPIYRSKIHSEKTFVTPASLINYGTGKLVMNLSSVHVCALFPYDTDKPSGRICASSVITLCNYFQTKS